METTHIIHTIQEGLHLVRQYYPTATIEGSTYDYSYWANGKVVALAIMNRRSKTNKWTLTICKTGSTTSPEPSSKPTQNSPQNMLTPHTSPNDTSPTTGKPK